MGLTSIGSQLTPGTPTQITFAAPLGLPNPNQSLIIIGHAASSAPTGMVAYKPIQIGNTADPVAASGEAAAAFGAGSELAAMVVAAVKANAELENFPPIVAVPLAYADTDWGSALDNIDKLPGNYIVSPYDGNGQTLSTALLNKAAAMSGAQRVENGQYGIIGVAANKSVTNPSSLFEYDTAYGSFQWMRDSAPVGFLGELAASAAAQMASNTVPYNPLKNVVMPNILAPASQSDWISVGAGMESEVALAQGWCPIRVLPNGNVANLRTRTLRTTVGDGITKTNAYFDVQDFNVLFFWRKTLCTRFNASDFARAKASPDQAKLAKSEVIRLAQLFQANGMFQAIDQLAKSFKVERNVSDRSRFDVFTPVNVIPILAVLATNINATTEGDTLTL